jgi:hypothetical protein
MIFGGRPEEKHQKARLLLAAVQNRKDTSQI